jgi:hypothetical protein
MGLIGYTKPPWNALYLDPGKVMWIRIFSTVFYTIFRKCKGKISIKTNTYYFENNRK